MNELAVIEKAEIVPTLDELAALINADHLHVQDSLRAAVEKAIEIGEQLSQARMRVGRGWGAWCVFNIDLPAATISTYILMATYKRVCSEMPSVTAARRFLMAEGHLLAERRAGRRTVNFDLDLAGMLRQEGWSDLNIARVLDVSTSQVRYGLLPHKGKAELEIASRKRKERRSITKELEDRSARAAAADKIGGGVNATFKAVRRAQIDANNLSETGSTPEIRQAATLAYRAMCRAEDEIAKILVLG